MRPAPVVPTEGLFLLLALALALACGGCPSFSTLQVPRTVPNGELRFAALAGAEGALSDSEGPTPREAQFELSVRYGLSDRIDVGVKLYALGIEAGVKWLILRGPLDIAIAPALSYASFDDTMGTSFNAFYAHLPLLMGWNISDRVTLSFGPKLLFGYQFRSGDVVRDDLQFINGLLVGIYVSVPIRVARAFWIAPEVNAYANVTNGAIGSVTIYQGGLAFMFGGADSEARPAPEEPTDTLDAEPPPPSADAGAPPTATPVDAHPDGGVIH